MRPSNTNKPPTYRPNERVCWPALRTRSPCHQHRTQCNLATLNSGTRLNAALALKTADFGLAMRVRADRRPVDRVCGVRLADAAGAGAHPFLGALRRPSVFSDHRGRTVEPCWSSASYRAFPQSVGCSHSQHPRPTCCWRRWGLPHWVWSGSKLSNSFKVGGCEMEYNHTNPKTGSITQDCSGHCFQHTSHSNHAGIEFSS